MTTAPFHSCARIIFATIALLLMRAIANAQDVTEPSLKAAFVYNFAKFTEWPADVLPATGPFSMCVLGDTAVGKALEQAVQSRILAGHSMTVSQIDPAGPQPVCHVLYISGIPATQATRIIAGLRDTPVLTISDIPGFTELGGIAQFFFEHGQLRFAIKDEFARRARLKISAKLLLLAKRK